MQTVQVRVAPVNSQISYCCDWLDMQLPISAEDIAALQGPALCEFLQPILYAQLSGTPAVQIRVASAEVVSTAYSVYKVLVNIVRIEVGNGLEVPGQYTVSLM